MRKLVKRFRNHWKLGSVMLIAAVAGAVFIATAVISFSCSPVDRLVDVPEIKIAKLDGEPDMRILLVKDAKNIAVTSASGKTAAAIKNTYTVKNGAIYKDGERAAKDELVVTPREGGLLKLGRFSYRGVFRISTTGGKLRLVNELPLEDYLVGVLGAEMPHRFPRAALRAQTIAARTYALDRKFAKKTDSGYDVVATTADQVYKGTLHDTAKMRSIIESTRGIVLTWNGDVFTTYFHSTCGGRTRHRGRQIC